MATILDSGVLAQFSVIFSFLLVVGIIYGILSFTKLFHDSKVLHALIAFLAGVFILITPRLSEVITNVVPWLTLFFILILFFIIAFKMFGASDGDVLAAMAGNKGIFWTVFTVFLLAMIWAVFDVYYTPTAATIEDGGFTDRLGAVFFHPQMLGAVLLMLIAIFAVALLAGEAS